MDAFNVYLNGKLIDTIYCTKGQETSEEVRRSLIKHDGYNPEIVVKKGR